jgi:adenine-specific DNA-methyltransferase
MIQTAIAPEEEPAIVLDFFAGSGSTGHAVLNLHSRAINFILVQLPEETGRSDYHTIADITKERLRRVVKKFDDEDRTRLDLGHSRTLDRGFRVFKLAESNFKVWEADKAKNAEALGEQLALHIDHIREGRAPSDLLYEILLKSGFPLTAPVEELNEAGKSVFSVAGGALLICLERELTLEVVRAMADRNPERVVCLDESFAGNDQLKTNAVQTFKTKGVVFRTV